MEIEIILWKLLHEEDPSREKETSVPWNAFLGPAVDKNAGTLSWQKITHRPLILLRISRRLE
jgi:hypothetical protein